MFEVSSNAVFTTNRVLVDSNTGDIQVDVMTPGPATQLFVKTTYNGVTADMTTLTFTVTCSPQTLTTIPQAAYQFYVPMTAATVR